MRKKMRVQRVGGDNDVRKTRAITPSGAVAPPRSRNSSGNCRPSSGESHHFSSEEVVHETSNFFVFHQKFGNKRSDENHLLRCTSTKQKLSPFLRPEVAVLLEESQISSSVSRSQLKLCIFYFENIQRSPPGSFALQTLTNIKGLRNEDGKLNMEYKIDAGSPRIKIQNDLNAQFYLSLKKKEDVTCFPLCVTVETDLIVSSNEGSNRVSTTNMSDIEDTHQLQTIMTTDPICKVEIKESALQIDAEQSTNIDLAKGVDVSYNKAWRAREIALEIMRGTPDESY
ncbi:hypothetical protein L484_021694 [Morus notabilis]|uniref:Uncharacterized protein n=1 Tax=Morus notabilis TaxID=981085 RepID=W9SES1_9ROSA|nr:hypothetical protein L484_021694 [Morus notabilis]